MSLHDRVVAQLSLAADGALLGVGVAYVAYRCIWKLAATSSALRRIQDAPCVHPSDLRSLLLLLSDESTSNNNNNGKLVIVRGTVDLNSNYANSGVLISQESGDKCVILQRTQTCISNEWRAAFGWTTDLRSILSRSWKEQQSCAIRMVPFVLVESGKWPQSDYVTVNMEGSRHLLPLTTVYHQLQPINASPYTFLQAFMGFEYPIGLLDEEKILPLGKDITAVGICKLTNGIPEIKSCRDLPYFLTDLTKYQMISDLSFKTKVLMWSGIVFGSLAIGILGYSIARNWNRWKEWRIQRRAQQQNDPDSSEISGEVAGDEESGDVPDGELCVVCLMRRRRSAFIPCGHLVCCQRCALSVEREASPKCPVCRQAIRSSVRIYDS